MPAEPEPRGDSNATADGAYTARLLRLEQARWRRVLNVQAPYRWHIRHLGLGRTLDVGCGIGRNLSHLDGNGIGIDHNEESVAVARSRGLVAHTPADFLGSADAVVKSFDSMLLAHVVEHMSLPEARELIRTYLPYVKAHGKVCLITPQEAGYRSDATHVQFVDFAKLRELSDLLSLTIREESSFPLPRWAGRFFPHNEFVVVAELDAAAS